MKQDIINWLKSLKFDVKRLINTECIDFGVTYNWNIEYALEITFFFWRFDISKEKDNDY